MGAVHGALAAVQGREIKVFHQVQRGRPASRGLPEPDERIRHGKAERLDERQRYPELENLDRIPAEQGGDLYLINGNMTKLADAGLFGTGQQGQMICKERSRDPMKKFWNWKSRKIRDQDSGEARTERVLFLNGTIAEESW